MVNYGGNKIKTFLDKIKVNIKQYCVNKVLD